MAIIILMVALVSAVVGTLEVATAKSDVARARKQADYIDAVQECTNQANRWLAGIDLNDGSDGTLSGEFTDGKGHTLTVEVTVGDGTMKIRRWDLLTEWTDEISLHVK